MKSVSAFLKWLAWILIALLVLAAVIYFFLRYFAHFTPWAKNLLDWFSKLFRRKPRSRKSSSDDAVAVPPVMRPPPFDSFANPFENGSRMPLPQMVCYSFAALESWAWERGIPREHNETPIEFARRLERETGLSATPLVTLHGHVLYSATDLPTGAAITLKQFWADQPLQSNRRA